MPYPFLDSVGELLMVKVAAWVELFEPVYSKSGNFEALHFLNFILFARLIE